MKSHLPSFVPNAPFTQAFMHSAQKTKGLLSRLYSATGEKKKKKKKRKKKKSPPFLQQRNHPGSKDYNPKDPQSKFHRITSMKEAVSITGDH